MQHISKASMLDIWDAGQTLGYNQRALLLLRLSEPDSNVQNWLDMPVGQRNAALLQLRQDLFGDHLVSVEPCPDCGQWVECSASIDDLLQHGRTPVSEAVTIALQDATVSCRLPTPRDIDAVIASGNNTESATMLLARCLLDSDHGKDKATLCPDALQHIDDALAAADPLANISFLLHCDNCNQTWDAPFDVVSYLWEECAMDAKRLLIQVHNLASVYHWSEAYILQMSEHRRQFYLGCIGA